MNNKSQIGLLRTSLKRTLAENGLATRFTGHSSNEASFVSLSGAPVSIYFRSALSPDFISGKIQEMADVLSKGGQLLFVSPRISQQLINSQVDRCIHFYSPNGFSRIRLPGFTYIVHAPVSNAGGRQGNAGSAFVGKATVLPRLFFMEPERIWQQSELALESGLTRSYVSIIIKRMLEAGYILQDGRGYRLQSPDKMLDDWSGVYRFDRYVWKREYALAFRHLREGMDRVAGVLAGKTSQFALMGQCGAYLRCPYMEPSVVSAYVSEPLDGVPGLHPVEGDGNVVLYVPQNQGFFVGKNSVDNLPVVSDIQLYLDLKKMPGRSVDQAEYLRENLLSWDR